jgi:phosphoribosylamine--glycine ligase
MNVLIIGNGAREHALAWKIAQSPSVEKIWVAPGNAGTALEEKTENIAIQPTDIERLKAFAKSEDITLTIVGPEAPLAEGIVDSFQRDHMLCLGPVQKAAQLESSKIFCKDFLQRHHIPTAKSATFSNLDLAIDYVKKQNFPIVIKADGLAGGKGVFIPENLLDAEEVLFHLLKNKTLGEAGSRIIIEEYITGEELSFIVLTDGHYILPLASSQDHKRRDDGDHGPNTGGMGAYSPAPRLSPALYQKVMSRIIEPTIQGLAKQGIPYVGFLYAGLMITADDEPYVLEFNCRLGDPEAQAILMRLDSDLASLAMHAVKGELHRFAVQWDPRFALTVVMTANGYPGQYQRGDLIQGIPVETDRNSKVFYGGASLKNDQLITDGGRVLSVTALGKNLLEANQKAYSVVKQISWENCHYRTDIGYRALVYYPHK